MAMNKGAVLIAAAIVVAGALIGAGLYLGQRREAGRPSTSKDAAPVTEQTVGEETVGDPIEPLPLDPTSAAEELARRYGTSYCGDPYINGETAINGGQIFVPECLDREEDPRESELAVWAAPDGQVIVFQQGQPSCYVNLEATNQDELCTGEQSTDY